MRRLITLVLLCSLGVGNRANAAGALSTADWCGRTLALFTASAALFPLQTVALVRLPFLKATYTGHGPDRVFAVTNRNPLHYIDTFNLWGYDFRGKDVLDVGAGLSRFDQFVNLANLGSGTEVTGVDLHAPTPFLYWPGRRLKADAFALPIADKSMDLTLNNWMFTYFTPRRNFDPERGPEQRELIRQLMAEHLRVTRDGGQVKIFLPFVVPESECGRFLAELLANDPRVETFAFVRRVPRSGHVLEVKLRAEDAPPRSGPAKEERGRRVAVSTVFTLGLAAAVAGLFGRILLSGDDDDGVTKAHEASRQRAQEALRAKNPAFEELRLSPLRSTHRAEDAAMMHVTLATLQHALVDADPNDLTIPKRIVLSPTQRSGFREGGVLVLNIHEPEAVDRFLRRR